MKKRVLFFTDSLEFGGAERSMVNLMAGLDQERWEKGLFYHPSPGVSPLLENARSLGVWIKAVAPMPLGARGAKHSFSFAREIHSHRPVFFHANLTWPLSAKYALLAALLARVPFVIAVLHSFVDIPYSRPTRIQLRILAQRINNYITVSQDMKNKVMRTFDLPEEKVLVIHNGIPVEPFLQHEDHEREEWRTVEGKRPAILTTSRLVERKGLEDLLVAAARLPEAVFLLAGDGPLRSALEAQARALGVEDRVIFLGYCEDIKHLLAACDLFVLPSLSEGMPLSILEAMAAGKAVVASQTGGIGEAVIHGETGWLVPPGDPECLAGAIRSLLGDPRLALRFGEAGRARVLREFTVDRMVEKYTSIYESLLSLKGAAYGT